MLPSASMLPETLSSVPVRAVTMPLPSRAAPMAMLPRLKIFASRLTSWSRTSRVMPLVAPISALP
ncbi:hypothetical protein NB689_002882 [Xanthomonas sacchari]|nr:hypothetical protein [Xanthomonas sacchari]